jgi:hypothetical protein
MTKRVWFPYQRRGQSYLPFLGAHLRTEKWKSSRITFLLDSGSSYTFVPMAYAGGLLDPDTIEETDTGCRDLSNNPIIGARTRLQLVIPGLEPIIEEVVFSSSLKAQYGVLGQCGVFEQLAAMFHNFEKAPKGRQFALAAPAF